ncbi:hypothetical protein ACP4OV_013424 [Aristida adscensionis]
MPETAATATAAELPRRPAPSHQRTVSQRRDERRTPHRSSEGQRRSSGAIRGHGDRHDTPLKAPRHGLLLHESVWGPSQRWPRHRH